MSLDWVIAENCFLFFLRGRFVARACMNTMAEFCFFVLPSPNWKHFVSIRVWYLTRILSIWSIFSFVQPDFLYMQKFRCWLLLGETLYNFYLLLYQYLFSSLFVKMQVK